jgi:lysophospholipase L1-like esterase
MLYIDRRSLLKTLALLLLAAVLSAPQSLFGQEGKPFELLVVGDSLIWGQGLDEKDKFYSHTAEWLRKSLARNVNVKVKAHSGSTLKFHEKEAAKYARIGRDESFLYKPEINVGFPSIFKQIEIADDEYRNEGKAADLIMVTGGITDITTSEVLDPKGNDDELKRDIERHLRDDLYDVLALAAEKNPEAKIVVVGYFPVITEYSESGKLLNAWLEALSFPRFLKFVPNNPLVRPLFFNKLRRRAIERSRLWFENSSASMAEAVAKINRKLGAERAFFVRSPLTEEHATEAPNTRLFRMGKGGYVKDAKARERTRDCREALPKLKRESGIDYPVRLCEIAAIGHPDPTGSRMYADAIIERLAGVIKR